LCEIGVLSRCGASQWLSPSFIIPKKDGRVRWISDFCKLNKQILHKVYHLPKIQDILNRRSGYTCFTKLDISMQYYTFELDEPSKEVCTICTPFGNYKYNRLPMGVSQAPDISQEIMEDLFRNFNEVDVYMDETGTRIVRHCPVSSMSLRLMDSQLIQPSANGQSRKRTG
jgi:Reverse transcriptase (RNA-dependent DNA polymerase)